MRINIVWTNPAQHDVDCVGSICSIDILKYIIYGLAAGFFVFGVLLLVEGFFTTGAIRDLYGEFKITACGRCLTAFVSFVCLFACLSVKQTIRIQSGQFPVVFLGIRQYGHLCPDRAVMSHDCLHIHLMSNMKQSHHVSATRHIHLHIYLWK